MALKPPPEAQKLDPANQATWSWLMLCSFVLFIALGVDAWAYCCALPMLLFFLLGWHFSTEELRVEKAAKAAKDRAKRKREKKADERREAVLKERQNQFAIWVMKNHVVDVKFWDSLGPTSEYQSLWDEWIQEMADELAAEKAAKEELARMEAAAAAARKQAEFEAAAARKKAQLAAREAARKKREAAKKAAARKAAAKKKQLKKDKASLRKALVDIQKRGLSKKIDNVFRHSKKDLLSVTARFDGIRKTGNLDQLKKSILDNFERWATQLAKIQELNAEITKDSTLEDLVGIKQAPSIDETRAKHPGLKKKATNLRRRIERRKEKLERVRKEAAFSRPMLQTEDVPNATLLRKEKAWNLNDGCCIRCDAPSSEMAFYWDLHPKLHLVAMCDTCAGNENFVHVRESGEGPVSDSESGPDSVPEWFAGAFDDSEN